MMCAQLMEYAIANCLLLQKVALSFDFNEFDDEDDEDEVSGSISPNCEHTPAVIGMASCVMFCLHV